MKNNKANHPPVSSESGEKLFFDEEGNLIGNQPTAPMSKLYTEKQLREAIAFGRPNISDLTIDDWTKRLTPIELPTDEEIDNASLLISSERMEFIKGAKWVVNKIKGGGDE